MLRSFTFAIVVGLGLGACSSRAPAPTGAAAPAGGAATTTTAPAADPSGGTGSSSPSGSGSSSAAATGEPCGDHPACTPPATCVSYYGIAGPRGPKFQSCEIRCNDDSACPKATHCTTIADGPGRVCR